MLVEEEAVAQRLAPEQAHLVAAWREEGRLWVHSFSHRVITTVVSLAQNRLIWLLHGERRSHGGVLFSQRSRCSESGHGQRTGTVLLCM